MRKIFKIFVIVLLAVLLAAGTYVIYVFADYSRIADMQELEIRKGSADDAAEKGIVYRIATYNIGFGAYSDDYSFFMDGGEESRARSADAVHENVGGAVSELCSLDPDFIFIQEVDEDGDRSFHIDQRQIIRDEMKGYDSVYARNYDSPYLMWPLNEPHGANKAGQMTFSRIGIASALRRSLPVEGGFMKFLDLDRCYSVSRVPAGGGRELVLYNFHLSAYTSDGTIAEEQLEMLGRDMTEEVRAGNHVIAGGDFNKDILGDSSAVFGISGDGYTWAQPVPERLIPEGMKLTAPLDRDDPVATCRNADRPYGPDDYLVSVDGFIVSDNVKVKRIEAVDTGFRWSDHNPVYMDFELIQDRCVISSADLRCRGSCG